MTNTNVIIGLSNIFVGVLTIAVCIPLLKDKIEMNRWYGIRFERSFESKENWYKINRYGAQRIIYWSVIIVVIGILTFFIPVGSGGFLPIIISCAPIILIIPTIESWLFAKKQ
jgi:hypothetical protein